MLTIWSIFCFDNRDLWGLLLQTNSLVNIWQQIAFHRQKISIISEQLHKLGLIDDIASAVLDLWQRFRSDVLQRLTACSMSGVPQVEDVNWSLHMAMASSDSVKMREPMVRMEFLTDQGPIRSEMNYVQLKQLYDSLQTVQENVDSSLK